MTISIANASVTITDQVTGITYAHDFVTNITIKEGQTNALAISPQGSGKGIAYRTGLTTPVTTDLVVRGTPVELAEYYKSAFVRQLRFDVMIMDTATNERYDINYAIISESPRSTAITEDETSLNQTIKFASPPAHFSHVPAYP